MKEIKVWTIDEYYENMKEYFQNSNKTDVVKIIQVGFGCSYQYWIKPSLMSRDKYIDIFWNHEPLMKRYFSSKAEMENNLKIDFTNTHGFILRWLWRDDEIVYQPTAVEGDVDDFIKWYKDAKKDEYFFGLKMDPFTYIGHMYNKKDSDGEEYFDDSSPEYRKDKNYSVFYQNITGPEFLEEEKIFTDENKHRTYKDDIIDLSFESESEYTPEAIEFFKSKTEFSF